MQQFAIFALIVWVPITVGLFTVMSPRKAAVVSLIGAWLVLPPTGIPLSGIPDYTKVTATILGLFIGVLLFDLPRLIAFRPRWYDLPVIVMCICPFVAAIANGDTTYDGISASLDVIFPWAFPYFFGRLYFGDLEGLHALALGMIVGGVGYIIPCLIEIRLSPQLGNWVYGLSGWGGIRLGGYRPKVFLANGLELGTWMGAASLAAWWIWRSGTLKAMAGIPFGTVLLPSLLITNVLCRSSGALLLLMIGMATLWGSVRFKTKAFLVALILLTPSYYIVRIPRLWSGEGVYELLKSNFDEERAWSLEFRFRNENLLVERALERPFTGWGGFGRSLQIDYQKLRAAGVANRIIPDGLWVIALGSSGFIGLAALTLVILLPPILFLTRFPPGQWLEPRVAPAAMFAVLLSLFMLDCILNAMINLIYVVAMGGLIATVPSRSRFESRRETPTSSTSDFRTKLERTSFAGDQEADLRYRSHEILAGRYADLGRSMASQGRRDEARSTWLQALDMWARLASTQAENPRYLASWSECCNDFAWFLIDQPDPDNRDSAQAISLVLKAIDTFPERADFWNTLGAAYYRAGEPDSAHQALLRSIALDVNQGSSYDFFYLSLACSQLDQLDSARSWYEQGVSWLDEHATEQPALERLAREAHESLVLRNHS